LTIEIEKEKAKEREREREKERRKQEKVFVENENRECKNFLWRDFHVTYPPLKNNLHLPFPENLIIICFPAGGFENCRN